VLREARKGAKKGGTIGSAAGQVFFSADLSPIAQIDSPEEWLIFYHKDEK